MLAILYALGTFVADLKQSFVGIALALGPSGGGNANSGRMEFSERTPPSETFARSDGAHATVITAM
jgi:hypothetical protein